MAFYDATDATTGSTRHPYVLVCSTANDPRHWDLTAALDEIDVIVMDAVENFASGLGELREALKKVPIVRSLMAEESLRIASKLVPPPLRGILARAPERRLKQPPQRFAFYQGAF